MRSSKPPRGCVRVRGTIVFASLLCSTCPPLVAQDPSPVPAQPGSREAWHEFMVRTPLPGKGCFKASYPSTDWQEVPCTTPPSFPLPRTRVGGNSSDTVGGGGSNDFVAQVTSGLISTAEGSFLSVTPGITETGIDPYTGQATANAFTLQLNTNTFTTPAISSCAPQVVQRLAAVRVRQLQHQRVHAHAGPSIHAVLAARLWNAVPHWMVLILG